MLRGTSFSKFWSGIAASLLVGDVSLGLAQGASASSLFPFQSMTR